MANSCYSNPNTVIEFCYVYSSLKGKQQKRKKKKRKRKEKEKKRKRKGKKQALMSVQVHSLELFNKVSLKSPLRLPLSSVCLILIRT